MVQSVKTHLTLRIRLYVLRFRDYPYIPILFGMGFGTRKNLFGPAGIWILRVPIGSMYGIFTHIYHKNQPNVAKYTIHGSYGVKQKPYKTLAISSLQGNP